jgi:hypothetical protein
MRTYLVVVYRNGNLALIMGFHNYDSVNKLQRQYAKEENCRLTISEYRA